MHFVEGYPGISGNGKADSKLHPLHESHRTGTLREQVYYPPLNSARWISKVMISANTVQDSNTDWKYNGYRLEAKASNRKPIPITRVKPLVAILYWLISRHTAVGFDMKQFGHCDDDQCQWCCWWFCTVALARRQLMSSSSGWEVQVEIFLSEVGYPQIVRLGCFRCGSLSAADYRETRQCWVALPGGQWCWNVTAWNKGSSESRWAHIHFLPFLV